jgi:site-specific recombinase XerD
MAARQIRRSDDNCLIPLYVHSNGPQMRVCVGLRVLFWPSGEPCWFANMFLVDAFRNGGSIATANALADSLSLFLRFLARRQLQIEEVDDERICAFADLLDRQQLRGARLRGGRQVNKIIRTTLRFLEWFQQVRPSARPLVGGDGSAALIRVQTRVARRRGRTTTSLSHASMVPEDVPRDVQPMSRDIFLQLLDACTRLADDRHVQERARLMLKLLHDTGARRAEINGLQVQDIQDALADEAGRLRLKTVKRRRGPSVRLVPVPRATLDAAMAFIQTARALLIHKLKRQHRLRVDPGWLLLNAHGRALGVETITQDIARLRAIAGIHQRAHAHMLRHRYLTIQALERIKVFVGRQLPMEMASTILTRLASLSGHSSIESLWKYIDLVFEEMGVWNSAEDVLRLRSNSEAALREIQGLRRQCAAGQPITGSSLLLLERALTQLTEPAAPAPVVRTS